MEPTHLEKAILQTLAWFSVSSYPVTRFELWKWMYQPGNAYSLWDVHRSLEKSEYLRRRIESKNGFFALRQSESIDEQLELRHDRFLDAVRKFAKLRRAARLFALLPSVKGVAAGNTLAWWHTNEQSDIDLFIITKPRSIWSTRAFLVLPFAVLGKRPNTQDPKNQKADPFCFSFFVTEQALALESLRLPGEDPYFSFWTRSLVPIFDREAVFDRMHKKNSWVEKDLPHASPRPFHPEIGIRMRFTIPVPRLESFARSVQMKRFPAPLKEQANLDSRIVITDEMLKFHSNDRRTLFKNLWKKRRETVS